MTIRHLQLAARTLVVGAFVFTGVLATGVDDADLRSELSRWISHGLLAGAALLLVIRAALVPGDRGAWLLFALGLVAWNVGNAYYWVTLVGLEEPPFPSWADAGFLFLLPCSYAAIILLVRGRSQRFPASVWLDGLVGAGSVSALAGALVVQPVLAATSGGLDVVLTNLAYPVGDMLLLAFITGVFALSGWRPGPMWALVAAGVLVFAVGDSIYLLEVSAGTYTTGGLVDASWPAAGTLIALAATVQSTERPLDLNGWRVLVPPFLFALLALGLLVAAAFVPVGPLPVVLAGATVLVAFARTALTFRDVRALADTRRQALTDELTGLANRRCLLDRLGAGLHATRTDGTPLGLLVLDLNRFKELNDTLGHHVGDLLLTELATRLRQALRDGDLIARLGGDEFAVLLRPGSSQEAAMRVARRLQAALERDVQLDGVRLQVQASIGIALAPEHADDVAGLLQRADVAMYHAKRADRPFELYQRERDEHSRDRLALTGELRHALDSDELVLHFQPQATLATGQVTGVEALVRWQHPTRGLLFPDAFIPLAEQSGLMRPLTLRVLGLALRQAHDWHEAGRQLRVAVNISAQNLLDLELPSDVRRLLETWEVDPALLQLEITENAVMADPSRAAEILTWLRDLGVSVALDDFGTGYSSLSYLKRLAVDELKIDRSFVRDMAAEPDDAAIVRATIDLAHSLKLRTIAEGVEDDLTWHALADLRCDSAQGYLLSRPLPALEFTAWLAEHRSAAADRTSRHDRSLTTDSPTTTASRA